MLRFALLRFADFFHHEKVLLTTQFGEIPRDQFTILRLCNRIGSVFNRTRALIKVEINFVQRSPLALEGCFILLSYLFNIFKFMHIGKEPEKRWQF